MGTVFVSLEDETGAADTIVLPHVFEKLRLTIAQETFLTITGPLEKSRGMLMIQSRQIEALN